MRVAGSDLAPRRRLAIRGNSIQRSVKNHDRAGLQEVPAGVIACADLPPYRTRLRLALSAHVPYFKRVCLQDTMLWMGLGNITESSIRIWQVRKEAVPELGGILYEDDLWIVVHKGAPLPRGGGGGGGGVCETLSYCLQLCY